MFRVILPDVAFLNMGVRVEVSCNSHRLTVYVETVGIMKVRQVVEEITHAATHIKNHF